MGTLQQLLLDAMRANAEKISNAAMGGQDPDKMSGFTLESVQVATIPYLSHEDDGEKSGVNPLVQFAQNQEEGRDGSNSMSNIMDHLVRLEEKVKILELTAPPEKYRQRIWLAPVSSKKSGGKADGKKPQAEEPPALSEDEPPEKGQSDPQGNPSVKSASPQSGRRVTGAPPVRLEKEERGCLARLLFSKCWTGKDDGARWKVKRNCPTHGSLSCPCGNIGPCKNVKKNACPLDQLKSTKPKKKQGKNKSGASPDSEGDTFASKPGKGGNHSKKTASRKMAKINGKPLIKKLLPCCFHKHTECCCRCTDNPKLSVQKKSEKPGDKADNTSKSSSIKSSRAASKGNKKNKNISSSDGTSASGGDDDANYDDPKHVNAVSVGSVFDFSKLKRPYVGPSRKRTLDSRFQSLHWRIPSKRSSGNEKDGVRDSKSRKRPENADSVSPTPQKSTTSFQITLHPVFSEGELPEPEVVRHEILKTLSTIHGPLRVEQKIVVQGTKHSAIIVTHGEACQCNLCDMLKGKFNHSESFDGSPQVVRISTNNGYKTLINHSDGCSCDLCGVLDPSVTENPGKLTPTNEDFVIAACSSANLRPTNTGEDATLGATPSPTRTNDVQDSSRVEEGANEGTRTMKIHSLGRKSMWKANKAGKKVRRCRCTKCRQRRRLKKYMGSEGFDKILQEITRSRDENDQKPSVVVKPSVQNDSDANDYLAPKKTKKVSFSNDTDPQYYYRVSGGKPKNMQWEELDINDSDIDKTDKRKNKIVSTLQHFDSAVYNVKATSKKSEGLDKGCEITLQDSMKFRRDSHFRKAHSLEEQKCFPPKHLPETLREKRTAAKQIPKNEMSEELLVTDGGGCASPCKSGCSGKFRQDGGLHEAMDLEQPSIQHQDGAFPSKFVYWSPVSRSNIPTGHSSESSYYVPDADEFPIVNMVRDESIPTSCKNPDTVPSKNVQIPRWFRMLPDRSPQ